MVGKSFLFGDIGAVRIGEGASALLENVQVHHHHLHHLLLLFLLLLFLRRKREPTHSISRESRHEGFDKEEKFRGKRGGGSGEGRRGPF